MSAEQNLENRTYDEIFANTPLLQSGELPVAPEIALPERLDPYDLSRLFGIASDYCRKTGYMAVAFTQFRPEMLERLGARTDIARIIYYTDNLRFSYNIRNSLVINPVSENITNEEQVNIEACGSIAKRYMGQIVLRNKNIKVNGHVWRAGYEVPQQESYNLSDLSASTQVHEEDHLNGKDASFLGEKLLDFSNRKLFVWDTHRGRMQKIWDTLHEFKKEFKWQGILVNRDGENVVVDFDGKYIQDFKRASSLRQ